jgi:uncharacterized protein with HEPN domain
MSDAETLLRHIEHCIARIEQDTKEGKEVFLSNVTQQDAVTHNLQIIGEASKKLPSDLKSKHNSIPWKEIAGMRDVIVHNYFGISYEIVWDVVQNRIPSLKKAIDDMLNKQ